MSALLSWIQDRDSDNQGKWASVVIDCVNEVKKLTDVKVRRARIELAKGQPAVCGWRSAPEVNYEDDGHTRALCNSSLDTSKLNVGRHEGVLTISTPCEDIAAIKIPYRAGERHLREAIPGRVFFGRCALGETKVEKTTIVVMPGIVDDDAEFQYTVSDPAILTIALGKKSTFGQELLVHLTPNAEGDIHETIMVDIEDDSKRFRSVIIPVVGRCYAKDNNADGNIVEKRALSLCGPHCIQYVLKRCGRNLTFEEVVEDIPSYHPNRGTTLYDLKKAIESHGFTTLAIRAHDFQIKGRIVL